ncbi:hypothetical protein [Brachybacterium kimchii]|uniref:Transposase n=1 Tax=Brachybacterium kimchii TaxID=2942909 RepID=A0ABY4N985_9MICO|nr:hypothetical protein [Brachybacterium kimchii]UQN30669.1 hypothetical protein M4486_05030 [Brachybacterium kimchii]
MATIKPDAVANPTRGSRGYLKWYWTKGEGLAKWAASPTPYRTLVAHLAKYMSLPMAKRTAANWFKAVFGIWPGERKGKNPLGPG